MGINMNIVLIELHKDEMKEKLYSTKIKYIIREYKNRTEKTYRKYSTSKHVTDFITAVL